MRLGLHYWNFSTPAERETHQKRMLDLCIARAEANEKAQPDKKGKEE